MSQLIHVNYYDKVGNLLPIEVVVKSGSVFKILKSEDYEFIKFRVDRPSFLSIETVTGYAYPNEYLYRAVYLPSLKKYMSGKKIRLITEALPRCFDEYTDNNLNDLIVEDDYDYDY